MFHQSISIWSTWRCIGTTCCTDGFRHWKPRVCLVWRTSQRVIVEVLNCALYECIGSMHRRVIGVWMMSVGYVYVDIFVFLHLLLYCSVLLKGWWLYRRRRWVMPSALKSVSKWKYIGRCSWRSFTGEFFGHLHDPCICTTVRTTIY